MSQGGKKDSPFGRLENSFPIARWSTSLALRLIIRCVGERSAVRSATLKSWPDATTAEVRNSRALGRSRCLPGSNCSDDHLSQFNRPVDGSCRVRQIGAIGLNSRSKNYESSVRLTQSVP